MQANPITREQLEKEAQHFNFFKAVHLLEMFDRGRAPGRGLSPGHDTVRFSVQPGAAFPASDIQSLETAGNGAAPRMQINFMGLIGPKGVLPDWYNTYARACNDKKDYGFTDFLDMFHHRLISLFYLAWKKYRLAENYRPDGSDPVSGILASLAGSSEREKTADPEFFSYARNRLIYFCGLLGRTVPTVAAMETVISHAVGAAVHVEQFVERLIRIHKEDRTCLGRRNSRLKHDALCGSSVRDISAFFRLHIGPLNWERYMAFVPGSRNLNRLRRLIAYLAGIEYEFEICLLIPAAQIPALGLGAPAEPPILGRTATLRRPDRTSKKDFTVSVAGVPTPATQQQKGVYDTA